MKEPDYKSMIDKNGRKVYKNSLIKYLGGRKTDNGYIPEIWISHIKQVFKATNKTSLIMCEGYYKNPCEVEVIDDTPERILLEMFEGVIFKSDSK